MPRVFVIPSEALNAFASGRGPKHAVVAATEGILRALNDDELKGVKELTQVKAQKKLEKKELLIESELDKYDSLNKNK